MCNYIIILFICDLTLIKLSIIYDLFYFRMIYEKLASALNEEDAILYRNRYEELEPSLRFCAYNIGNETDVNQLLHLRNQAQGDLLVTLDVSFFS